MYGSSRIAVAEIPNFLSRPEFFILRNKEEGHKILERCLLVFSADALIFAKGCRRIKYRGEFRLANQSLVTGMKTGKFLRVARTVSTVVTRTTAALLMSTTIGPATTGTIGLAAPWLSLKIEKPFCYLATERLALLLRNKDLLSLQIPKPSPNHFSNLLQLFL